MNCIRDRHSVIQFVKLGTQIIRVYIELYYLIKQVLYRTLAQHAVYSKWKIVTIVSNNHLLNYTESLKLYSTFLIHQHSP